MATITKTPVPLKNAAYAALGLGAASVILIILVHILKSDYDPSWRAISEYALGNFGWLMTAAFFAWGASGAAVVLALRKQVRTLPGKAGLGLLLLGSAGPLLAGLFPTDPYTTSVDALTTSGMVHSMAVVLCDFIPIGATFVTVSLLRKNPAWRIVKAPLVLAAIGAWVGFTVVSVAMMTILPAHGGKLGPEVEIGWYNRLMVLSYIGWVAVAAWAALKVSKSSK